MHARSTSRAGSGCENAYLASVFGKHTEDFRLDSMTERGTRYLLYAAQQRSPIQPAMLLLPTRFCLKYAAHSAPDVRLRPEPLPHCAGPQVFRAEQGNTLIDSHDVRIGPTRDWLERVGESVPAVDLRRE